MKLIPDWRRAWRYFSVWAATALTVLSFLQAQVLPLYQFAIPAHVWPWVTAGFGTVIVVLRVISQTPAADAATEDKP